MTNEVILAIDPGYDRMGWAIGKRQQKKVHLIEYGYLQTDKSQAIENRYLSIITYLEKLLAEFQPQELALETLFFSKNQKTAMRVAEIRGIIIGTCVRKKLTLHEYNPGSVKLTVTGNGKADKKAIEKMVRMEFKLIEEKIMDDALDAIAILITHTNQYSSSSTSNTLQAAIQLALKKERQ